MSRKVKYTVAFRKHCVDLVLKEHRSILSVSKAHQLHHSTLHRWILAYQAKGFKGLLPKKTKQYSPTFKLKILKKIADENLSMESVCMVYDIGGSSVIRNWKERYNLLGLEGLKDKPKGRQSSMTKRSPKTKKPLTKEEQLIAENKSLKAELDLLKKLHALAQAKKKKL